MSFRVEVRIAFVDPDKPASAMLRVEVSRLIVMPFVPQSGTELVIDGLSYVVDRIRYDDDSATITAVIEEHDVTSPTTDIAREYIDRGWSFRPQFDVSACEFASRADADSIELGASRPVGKKWIALTPTEAEIFDYWQAKKGENRCDS